MHKQHINIERILNYPIVLINFDDFFNCLYISTTKMCVCNYLNHFNSFIVPELILIEKSGWGKNI